MIARGFNLQHHIWWYPNARSDSLAQPDMDRRKGGREELIEKVGREGEYILTPPEAPIALKVRIVSLC